MISNNPVNILYLHSHDTGRYLNVYGYPVETPHLRELAQQSLTFRNAFSVAPTCSPSRSGLLTGTYPHENGMIGLAHRGFILNDPNQHLARYLQGYGYETVLCGVQHVAPDKMRLGYSRILDAPEDYFTQDIRDLEMYDTKNAELAARFIKTEARSPFFLSYGMLNTHRPFPEQAELLNSPWTPPQRWTPRGVMPQMEATSEVDSIKDTRADTARFHQAVKTMDHCVGIVLNALAESGLVQNTVIIYTTDHGIAFPNMKATLYDSGTGVALLLRLPQNRRSVGTVESLVSQLDIFPTLCGLCGLPIPDWTRGRSLIPLIEGHEQTLHPYIFTETTFHAAYEPARAIRSSRCKLIKHFGEYQQPLAVNVDDSPSKRLFYDNGYFAQERAREQLFDLLLDPAEKANRRDDPAYRDIYQTLHEELITWMRQTHDPLLQGAISLPRGAVINSPVSYSPTEALIDELHK